MAGIATAEVSGAGWTRMRGVGADDGGGAGRAFCVDQCPAETLAALLAFLAPPRA